MTTKMQLTRCINQSPPYVIDRSSVSIYFVSTRDDWTYCVGRLLSAQVMGFDTETRPTRGKNQRRNSCALLQIAVRDAQKKEEVFILDLLNVHATLYNDTLMSVFLSNKSIKLGQSFYHDLQELALSYPHASCFTVCKGVVEMNDLSISLAGAHNPLSLQKLVYFYLHRKLVKTQQLSNWERRPLTASQLHYAAADALVLLHLYDELLLRIQKQCTGTVRSFQLSDVANVLDVNIPPASKCSLCFEVFKTSKLLQQHRKNCLADVRTLAICAVCGGKKLVTEEIMKHHVKHCGMGEEAEEPVVQVKRKRSLSVKGSGSPTKLMESASAHIKVKRRRKTKRDTTDAAVNFAEARDLAGAKRQKQKARKKRRRDVQTQALACLNAQLAAKHAASQKTETSRCCDQEQTKRKMSMESSLLASDAMWSQISSDLPNSVAD